MEDDVYVFPKKNEILYVPKCLKIHIKRSNLTCSLDLMHKNFFCLSASFFTAIPYILKHICVVACMRWYYSLMPSYRFNCMCLQFYFSEFSSCYFFLTSASYGSLLLLFLYVFVFYDDFGIIFFRGNFFFWNFGKINICSSTSVQWIFVYFFFFFFNDVVVVVVFFCLKISFITKYGQIEGWWWWWWCE